MIMNDLIKNYFSNLEKEFYNLLIDEIMFYGFSYVTDNKYFNDLDINKIYVDVYERYKSKIFYPIRNSIIENTTILIKYFEEIEEYEKCHELLTLKKSSV